MNDKEPAVHIKCDIEIPHDLMNATVRPSGISKREIYRGGGSADSMRKTILVRDTHEVRLGGPCRGRTYGPLIKSQLLYQLS